MSTADLTEWIEFERQCCPFFEFEVVRIQQDETLWLHITGPEGVKEFILDEFELR